MLDILVACAEISSEYVELFRHSEALAAGASAVAEPPSELVAPAVAGPPAPAVAGPPPPAVGEPLSEPAVAKNPPGDAATCHSASIMKALAWATHLSYDDALLAGLAGSLPGTVLEEQLRLYEASQAVVAKPSKAPEQLLVHANLLSLRMQAACVSTSTRETAVGCQATSFHAIAVPRLSRM